MSGLYKKSQFISKINLKWFKAIKKIEKIDISWLLWSFNQLIYLGINFFRFLNRKYSRRPKTECSVRETERICVGLSDVRFDTILVRFISLDRFIHNFLYLKWSSLVNQMKKKPFGFQTFGYIATEQCLKVPRFWTSTVFILHANRIGWPDLIRFVYQIPKWLPNSFE